MGVFEVMRQPVWTVLGRIWRYFIGTPRGTYLVGFSQGVTRRFPTKPRVTVRDNCMSVKCLQNKKNDHKL